MKRQRGEERGGKARERREREKEREKFRSLYLNLLLGRLQYILLILILYGYRFLGSPHVFF